MGADVTGEATGLGKKRGRKMPVRPGGKHRSGNWPLVQASGAKSDGKRGVLVFSLGFTLCILRRRLIGSPGF